MTAALAYSYVAPGAPIILISDPEYHHRALSFLKDRDLIEPHVLHGIDTSERAIWIPYQETPWSPHGIRPPSHKVVSFWTRKS